ncbi:polyprenyl synthetase family protein [Actinomadura fibrosa]|uniref:Polyprenyl synthetase family protein n=1 Tax=Actinomadura fibrosa TaxID=111802 RepID=A0ABW2XA73_9ACTN
MTATDTPATSADGAGSAREAERALAGARALLDPALRAAVHGLPAPVRRVAGYHLGWWDERERPSPGAGGGKAIRPALALLCGEAAGGGPDAALPAAVAVELVHNFALLHDDIAAGAATRRRRPAAWSVFGTAPALLTGDSLMVAAMDALAAGPADVAPRALRDLAAGLQELCAGQSAGTRAAADAGATLDDCREVIASRTASLFGCACALGALYGGGSGERVRLLRMFGERLGHAFALASDISGIWGDPKETGRPVHADLAARRRSFPVVAALGSGTAAGRELSAAYETGAEFSPAVLAHLAGLVERTGARRLAADLAARNLADAAACLDAAGPSARPAAGLRAVAALIGARAR